MYVAGVVKDSKPQPLSQASNHMNETTGIGEQDRNAFQRKAFIGNYFSGPHCLFHPGLLG